MFQDFEIGDKLADIENSEIIEPWSMILINSTRELDRIVTMITIPATNMIPFFFFA